MADFSLTSVYVVPATQTVLPAIGSTDILTPGQVGIYDKDYVATATPSSSPYFYIAQGRENKYLLSSKRSNKISGCPGGSSCRSNVIEWYKVSGCATAATQITDITDFTATCGEDITLTLRAHSSYLDTLYFNGFTRSVTVKTPCCDCGADPCAIVDVDALINSLIEKLNAVVPGSNPDNIHLSQFYTFENIGGTTLRISAKPLNKYGQPCDVAINPYEFDRMWFRAFIYKGPATTADFLVMDACDVVATPTVIQRSSYPIGISEEIAQLEKNYYSYQAGYMKHLYRMAGYNQNFESYVIGGSVYDTYYIKINDFDRSINNWNDAVQEDELIIVAVLTGSAMQPLIEAALVNGLGTVVSQNGCITTTTTTTLVPPPTTTTTTTLAP